MGDSKLRQVSWASSASPDNKAHRMNPMHEQMVHLQLDSPVFLHEDVELECNFRLNNKQLYSIKW